MATLQTERQMLDQRIAELQRELEKAETEMRRQSLTYRIQRDLEATRKALDRLDAVESEAAKEARTRAREVAYQTAHVEHERAKATLDGMVMEYRRLPDKIRELEQRFALSLQKLNECKDAMEVN